MKNQWVKAHQRATRLYEARQIKRARVETWNEAQPPTAQDDQAMLEDEAMTIRAFDAWIKGRGLDGGTDGTTD